MNNNKDKDKDPRNTPDIKTDATQPTLTLTQESLHSRLNQLEEEWKKGQTLIHQTQAQMLRIEGAIALNREQLGTPSKELEKSKQ